MWIVVLLGELPYFSSNRIGYVLITGNIFLFERFLRVVVFIQCERRKAISDHFMKRYDLTYEKYTC